MLPVYGPRRPPRKLLPHELRLADDLLKMRPHRFAERGQPQPGGRADEQPAAESFFQSANGGAERGLRDVASLGGTGEAAFLARRQKIFDLLHFHVVLHERSSRVPLPWRAMRRR